MRQPLVLLGLVLIAGFGAYRAFKYGPGKKRFWGVVPIGFALFGGVVAPFIFGITQGAAARPAMAGIGGGELLILMVVGPLVFAVVSGAILGLVFRPTPRS